MTPADETGERGGPQPGAGARAAGEPRPSPTLAGWIRRRARNVRQRPRPAVAVGGAAFVAALLATGILPGVANRAATVPAALLASLVVGVALGFAVAFALELRTPRVADAAEAEMLVWAPVIARIPARGVAQPRRRAADRDVPSLIEIRGEAYDTLYERVTVGGGDPGLIAVTGDDPASTALVALNLGATAARRVRSTIVVDADPRAAAATRAARCRAVPGLGDVLAGRAEWAAVANDVIVGRGRTMELLPSSGYHGGGETGGTGPADPTPLLLQLRRRYDAVIVSAPGGDAVASAAAARAADCTLVVVRAAHTSSEELAALAAELRSGGARVGGIVLWESTVPPLPVGAAFSRGLARSVTGTEVGR